jgi:hypothetical protein
MVHVEDTVGNVTALFEPTDISLQWIVNLAVKRICKDIPDKSGK